MKILITKTSPEVRIPEKGSLDAAGYDLYVPEDIVVKPGRQVVPLGFRIELEKGTYAGIEARSGNESKGIEGVPYHVWLCRKDLTDMQIRRFDCDVLRGIVDADYRGVVGVILHNHDVEFTLQRGTKVAQMVIHRHETADFEEVESLSETERAAGGFGHTDKS